VKNMPKVGTYGQEEISPKMPQKTYAIETRRNWFKKPIIVHIQDNLSRLGNFRKIVKLDFQTTKER
jgi:hypothetical protein